MALALVQDGFRFRNDNGDEAGATWRQLQNVDDTIERHRNFRLRFLINASGDFGGTQFRIQYRKVGDADWINTPIE